MQETTTIHRGIFISLQIRLLVVFVVLFAVIFAGVFYWFYTFTTDKALELIESDMVATLQGTAAGVDVEELLALAADGQPNSEGFSDDPRYNNQLDWLDTMHAIEPRAWPYLYVRGEGPSEVIFLGDLFARYDPSRAPGFLEVYTSTGPLIQGLDGLTVVMEPYEDPWGRWVSAYIPLVNESGENVAALGLDFRADYVFQVQQAILDSVLVTLLITFTLLIVMVFLVSRNLTGPIRRLTEIARRIGEGDYEQDLTPLTNVLMRGEISSLAEVFSVMIGKVYQRETQLKREVAKLKIEVDQAKKEKQVAAITDSEYFRELQKKVRELRGE